jgi:hypothetical protein
MKLYGVSLSKLLSGETCMVFSNYERNLIYRKSIIDWKDIIEPDFFEQLNLIDWQAIFIILFKCHRNHQFSLTQTLVAIRQYGLFLFLIKKHPYVRMVPNQEIDVVLHAHLANIHQFETDCQNLFGVCIKHIPEFGIGKDSEQLEWQLAFTQTQKLFELNFGQGSMGKSTAACCEILLNCG